MLSIFNHDKTPLSRNFDFKVWIAKGKKQPNGITIFEGWKPFEITKEYFEDQFEEIK